MIPLPPVEATDDQVKAWVRTAINALETTPRARNWRWRALGMSVGEAMVDAPRTGRIKVEIPVGEMRILREMAAERSIGVETMVRRGFATWACAIAELDREDAPSLTRGGMLWR